MRKSTFAFLLSLLLAACGLSGAQFESLISRTEFEQIFPGHIAFYSYDDLAEFTSFRTRREAAMLLANVYHETQGLTLIEEEPRYRQVYCDRQRSYGCPAGADRYFGRGPIQLSWNWNYKDAGDALGLDLLNDPDLVARDPRVAWETVGWFWSSVPPNATFADINRKINGPQECNGGPFKASVQSRISAYRRISDILGVSPGGGLSC
jgi:chitinase